MTTLRIAIAKLQVWWIDKGLSIPDPWIDQGPINRKIFAAATSAPSRGTVGQFFFLFNRRVKYGTRFPDNNCCWGMNSTVAQSSRARTKYRYSAKSPRSVYSVAT